MLSWGSSCQRTPYRCFVLAFPNFSSSLPHFAVPFRSLPVTAHAIHSPPGTAVPATWRCPRVCPRQPHADLPRASPLLLLPASPRAGVCLGSALHPPAAPVPPGSHRRCLQHCPEPGSRRAAGTFTHRDCNPAQPALNRDNPPHTVRPAPWLHSGLDKQNLRKTQHQERRNSESLVLQS